MEILNRNYVLFDVEDFTHLYNHYVESVIARKYRKSFMDLYEIERTQDFVFKMVDIKVYYKHVRQDYHSDNTDFQYLFLKTKNWYLDDVIDSKMNMIKRYLESIDIIDVPADVEAFILQGHTFEDIIHYVYCNTYEIDYDGNNKFKRFITSDEIHMSIIYEVIEFVNYNLYNNMVVNFSIDVESFYQLESVFYEFKSSIKKYIYDIIDLRTFDQRLTDVINKAYDGINLYQNKYEEYGYSHIVELFDNIKDRCFMIRAVISYLTM